MGTARIGAAAASTLHSLCALGVAAAYFLAQRVCVLDLVAHPAQTLRLLLVIEAPITIGVYSWLRRDTHGCSVWKAIGRGLLALPVGAAINAFGAIVLGAPVGIKYWTVTAYWSLLMSLFTFVPAACAFGPSRMDWQRILSFSKLLDAVDYMISVPAYGAIIGAWIGAWPMPLDWERPWQEWPICVTYGAIAGYLTGMVASVVFIVALHRKVHAKGE
ncbi:phosphatidylinositol-glycan biosynthesis class F protein [Ananas comosus]|uniref:Phosphatidylinositol-glycan biosynthesis class F protein n=1 Tax=Ananas comosus TaxID=4615 RepID=A0A199W8X3_ANACO|nr:phosphatidylinositol-glycan biosynthesis class F protein [Ananas comosus]OAY85345.1 Phosphatidylinositol-glycan biosynthesis class F protein [Ananas comosus]